MDTYNVFPCRLELVANRQRQVAVLGRHAVVDIKQAEVITDRNGHLLVKL